MTRKPAYPTRRAGFTLIELMVVIVVIAVLAAVLFPAITSVISRTRSAAVKSEITALGSNIADFKSEFGVNPPSFITFDTAHAKYPATKSILRKMFPQISFTGDSDSNGTADFVEDLTDAGLAGETLYGPEALVFFLGGVRKTDTAELQGFSKNPARPLQQATGGTSRLGPFADFDSGRLVEVTRDTAGAVTGYVADVSSFANKPLAYLDRYEGQDKPLLYFSTQGKGGYDATDCPELTDGAYKKSATDAFNADSFQIISAGSDFAYGVGGVLPNSNAAARPADDNLANFAEGTLGEIGT